MQAASSTVQQVIEALADTILQIVVFHGEVNANDSHLDPPDFAPVLSSVEQLVGLALKKAMQWTETEEVENKKTMQRNCATVLDLIKAIKRHTDKLLVDKFDRETKKELMFDCRSVMQQTVHLLQLADAYDIRKINRLVRQSKIENEIMVGFTAETLGTLQDAVQAYIFTTQKLGKMLDVRENYIVNPVTQSEIAESNEVVKTQPEVLVKWVVALLQAPDNDAYRAERDRLKSLIDETLDALVPLIKKSHDELWVFNWDLPPFDEYEDGPPPRPPDEVEPFRERLAQPARKVIEAPPKEAVEAAKFLEAEIQDQLAQAAQIAQLVPAQRAQLGQMADQVHSAQRAVFKLLDDYGGDPSDRNKPDREKALRDLLDKAGDLADLCDDLIDSDARQKAKPARRALEALDDLEDALLDNDKDTAFAKAKQLCDTIKGQLAEINGWSPEEKKGKQGEIDHLNKQVPELLGQLLMATKKHLGDPSRENKDAVDRCMANVRDLEDELNKMLAPPKKKKPVKSLDRLNDLGPDADRALDQVMENIARGQPREAKDAAQELADMLAQPLAQAQAMGGKKPRNMHDLLAAARRLAERMEDLLFDVPADGAPTDPTKLAEDVQRAKDALQEFASMAPLDPRIVPVATQLLDKMRDDVAQGRPQDAHDKARKIKDLLDPQMAQACAGEGKKPRQMHDLLAAANALASSMRNLLFDLPTDGSPADPTKVAEDVTATRKAFDDMVSALNDDPLLANVAADTARLRDLGDDTDHGRSAPAHETMNALMASARAIAGDPRVKRAHDLLGAAKAAADAMEKLRGCLDSALDAPRDPTKKAAFHSALEDAVRANDALAVATAKARPAKLLQHNLLTHASALADAIAALADATRAGNARDTDAACAELLREAAQQHAIATALAGKVKDAKSKKQLLDAAAALAAAMQGLTMDSHKALHDSIDDLKKLTAKLGALSSANKDLVSASDPEAQCALAHALLTSAVEGGELLNDSAPLTTAKSPYVEAVDEQLRNESMLAGVLEDRTTDMAKKQGLAAARKEIDAARDKLGDAYSAWRAAPESSKTQARMRDALSDAKDASDRLNNLSGLDALQRIERNTAAISDELPLVDEALAAQNGVVADEAAKMVVARLRDNVAIADDLAAECDNMQVAAQLGASVAATKKLASDYEAAMREAAGDPSNADAVARANALGAKARAANAQLTELAKKSRAGEESIDHGGVKDQMRSAAKQAQVATRQKLKSKQPADIAEFYTATSKLAELLRALTDACIANDKDGMIKSSRALSQIVNDAQKAGAKVAASCEDRDLKNDLLGQMTAAKNYAVQLKILAAVKASNPNEDPTTEESLVTCARGISSSVIGASNAAERCAIRARKK